MLFSEFPHILFYSHVFSYLKDSLLILVSEGKVVYKIFAVFFLESKYILSSKCLLVESEVWNCHSQYNAQYGRSSRGNKITMGF